MTIVERHAVVTGGSSGVGAQCAIQLAEAGANVTIVGRRAEALELVAERSPRITAAVADVTVRSSLEQAVSEAREHCGPIEILVASAGLSSSKPFHRLTAEDIRELIEVNLVGVFTSFQLVQGDMRAQGWGRMIAIASTAGLTGYPYVAHYCASKHAVIGLVKALAKELGSSGTTANALCPSYVDTPMTDRTIDNIVSQTGRSRDEALEALVAANPQGRLVTPAEVASTVLWLCQDGAASINGQAIPIDGGEL